MRRLRRTSVSSNASQSEVVMTSQLGVALGIGSITVVVLLSKQRRTQRDANAGSGQLRLAGLFIFRIAAMHRP